MSNNGRWKDGRTTHQKGYISIRVKNHPRKSRYIFEHILVMEKILGRNLRKKEFVHHKNGIRYDNDPKNLELWTREHPSGTRVKDLLSWARSFILKYDKDSQ